MADDTRNIGVFNRMGESGNFEKGREKNLKKVSFRELYIIARPHHVRLTPDIPLWLH